MGFGRQGWVFSCWAIHARPYGRRISKARTATYLDPNGPVGSSSSPGIGRLRGGRAPSAWVVVARFIGAKERQKAVIESQALTR